MLNHSKAIKIMFCVSYTFILRFFRDWFFLLFSFFLAERESKSVVQIQSSVRLIITSPSSKWKDLSYDWSRWQNKFRELSCAATVKADVV